MQQYLSAGAIQKAASACRERDVKCVELLPNLCQEVIFKSGESPGAGCSIIQFANIEADEEAQIKNQVSCQEPKSPVESWGFFCWVGFMIR